ncbi:MAG: hypothetical protein LIO69_06795 [Oscillospiraceae bacterium]|nr:hypothetical protein [Oscillospiraceae bacterium]
MKFKKLIATVVASALAAVSVSAMSVVSVSAADTYHAYIGVQSASYTFRNAWNETSYGQGVVADDGTVYFDQLTGWEGADAVNKGGDFVDAEITGDGTYSVSVSNFDFGEDESFNLLFVSTDIPIDTGATITDVKVVLDGNTKYTFDEAYLSPDENTYLQPMAINIWNDDLGGSDGLFGYIMPTDSIEIQFTVSGLGDAAAAEETEEEEEEVVVEEEAVVEEEVVVEETVAVETTTAAKTGNASAAGMVAVAAVAAATAVVTSKKFKK